MLTASSQIVEQVYRAKTDLRLADQLIASNLPFIKAHISKQIGRPCDESDDTYSIGMIAFHEAIIGYSKEKGAFFAYAALLIKSRLIDYHRKESKHHGLLSIDSTDDADENPLSSRLVDPKNAYAETEGRIATQKEIEELRAVLNTFGVDFTDIAMNAPKQDRTLAICQTAVTYAVAHPHLLDELLQTGKLPLNKLVDGTGLQRKTLERHRRYLLAMLLIQTNGYEIIRGHLQAVKRREALEA